MVLPVDSACFQLDIPVKGISQHIIISASPLLAMQMGEAGSADTLRRCGDVVTDG